MPETGPDLVFATFIAKAFGIKVMLEKEMNRNLQYNEKSAFFEINVDGPKIRLAIRPVWKVGTKKLEISTKMEILWSSRGEQNNYRYLSGMIELTDDSVGILPERFMDIYKSIRRGDYDIDKFVEKSKHMMSSKKFGL